MTRACPPTVDHDRTRRLPSLAALHRLPVDQRPLVPGGSGASKCQTQSDSRLLGAKQGVTQPHPTTPRRPPSETRACENASGGAPETPHAVREDPSGRAAVPGVTDPLPDDCARVLGTSEVIRLTVRATPGPACCRRGSAHGGRRHGSCAGA
jgi:hypothetical protein